MAGQTFPEAAKARQRVRRNFNSLRGPTRESVNEHLTALSKYFENICMS